MKANSEPCRRVSAKIPARTLKTGYHGTKVLNAVKILSEGFKLDARLNRDPGDLGRGIYLYPKKRLAKMLNECVLEVVVDVSNFLKLEPPRLYEVIGELRRKFGCTIRGNSGKNVWKERVEASWKWREHFLKSGYKGLLVVGWDTGRKDGYEMVVFDTSTIKKARLVWVSSHSGFVDLQKKEDIDWVLSEP